MLSQNDLQVLHSERYQNPCPKILRYLDILWFKHLGYQHLEISRLTQVSRSTIQRVLRVYRLLGLAGILSPPTRSIASKLHLHQSSLVQIFDLEPPRSVRHAQQVIAQQTGIVRGLTQVRHFLHRLELKPRRLAAVPLPPKKTLEEHVETQETYRKEQLEPRLTEAREGKRQVFFLDASHFVYATFVGILWTRTRRFIRAASGRQRFNVLGALDAVTHQLLTVTNETYINALTICEMLHKVANQAKLPITIVLDNARYQKCQMVQKLAEDLGLELFYLPSYSPNLNLIERLWKFVKKEVARGKSYGNYKDFQKAISGCLDDLPTKHKDQMKTLLTHKFQSFKDVSLITA